MTIALPHRTVHATDHRSDGGIYDLPESLQERLARVWKRPSRIRCYGNLDLLRRDLAVVPGSFGPNVGDRLDWRRAHDAATEIAKGGRVLVTPVGTAVTRHVALVPLRWGNPRVLVLSCGIRTALGPRLRREPFFEAEAYRSRFDPRTDLVVSMSSDDAGRLRHSVEVERLCAALALLGGER